MWWYIRYLNQWGEVASRYPQDTMVMTYESFRDDPRTALERIARQLRLDLSPAALDAGVAGGTKEAMARPRTRISRISPSALTAPAGRRSPKRTGR